MGDYLPNMDLLKSPSNWMLVAFAVTLLIFISNILFKKVDE